MRRTRAFINLTYNQFIAYAYQYDRDKALIIPQSTALIAVKVLKISFLQII
jgi:hypothetical protein